MNANTKNLLVAGLGIVVALGNAYLQGGWMAVLTMLPTIFGAGGAGAVLIKRFGDLTPHQAAKMVAEQVGDT